MTGSQGETISTELEKETIATRSEGRAASTNLREDRRSNLSLSELSPTGQEQDQIEGASAAARR